MLNLHNKNNYVQKSEAQEKEKRTLTKNITEYYFETQAINFDANTHKI